MAYPETMVTISLDEYQSLKGTSENSVPRDADKFLKTLNDALSAMYFHGGDFQLMFNAVRDNGFDIYVDITQHRVNVKPIEFRRKSEESLRDRPPFHGVIDEIDKLTRE